MLLTTRPFLYDKRKRSSEMAQWVKVLTAKSSGPELDPVNSQVKRENQFPKSCSKTPTHTMALMHLHIHTNAINAFKSKVERGRERRQWLRLFQWSLWLLMACPERLAQPSLLSIYHSVLRWPQDCLCFHLCLCHPTGLHLLTNYSICSAFSSHTSSVLSSSSTLFSACMSSPGQVPAILWSQENDSDSRQAS